MDPRIDRARAILRQEAQAIDGVAEQLGRDFVAVVDRILTLSGRVVTAGMGKAGIIAQKVSATFASTGTPSIFLHPAEAIHGDLGRVQPGDLILMFSKSGETDEVLRLLGPVRAAGVAVVGLTQSRDSTLGRHCDHVLELGAIDEADSHKLAPSASTAAMLALGDALALVVQEGRNFGPAEFARYHPGGDLGRRLMRVSELMRTGAQNPRVHEQDSVLSALEVMTRTPGRPGATSVVAGDDLLVGFFTDGDLRRLLQRGVTALDRVAIREVMTPAPKTLPPDTFAIEALALLRQRSVDQMPVVDADGRLLGLLDVQDLLDLKFG
jgi:arabinose-5-phosphate isomerase